MILFVDPFFNVFDNILELLLRVKDKNPLFNKELLSDSFVESFFCGAFCSFEFLHVRKVHDMVGLLVVASVLNVGLSHYFNDKNT